MSNIITDPRQLGGAIIDGGLGQIAPPLANAQQAEILVRRQKGETIENFYRRAEAMGIGRKCLSCGGKRRYSKVQCPFCFQFPFTEIKGAAMTDGKIELPEVTIDDSPMDQPVVEGGGEYAFIPVDPNSPEAQERAKELDVKAKLHEQKLATQQAAYQGITLQSMDVSDLQAWAKEQGVSLGKAKTKDAIIAKIEEHVGGFRESATPADAARITENSKS